MRDRERPEPGRKTALALTLLVHAGLFAALFIGVQWKTEEAAVQVELWSPITQEARIAPPPPPPLERIEEPPPRKPKIVTKKEEPKPEKPKPEKPRTERPEPVRTPERQPPTRELARLADEELRDIQRASLEAGRTRLEAEAEETRRATGQRSALANWSGKILEKVRGNIALPQDIEGNPEALLEVTLLPSGEILAVRIKRSSNNAVLDAAIERAFWKSSPLPKPDDPSIFRRQLDVTYRPYL
ncbi:MAG: TonB C-terminal domain-containing protein [Zoogloeaceae bacterium]|jgi:colicin import membrane protein|nr:TonB C-terminal domain-containing protein [Zoogloeaceae bacterium]